MCFESWNLNCPPLVRRYTHAYLPDRDVLRALDGGRKTDGESNHSLRDKYSVDKESTSEEGTGGDFRVRVTKDK